MFLALPNRNFWLRQCLMQHNQCVNISDALSHRKPLDHGVSQGLVLCPIFLRCTQHPSVIQFMLLKYKIHHLYAGDTQIHNNIGPDNAATNSQILHTRHSKLEKLKLKL